MILTPGSKLYVLDGQHRYTSITSAISKLRTQSDIAQEEGDLVGSERFQQYIQALENYPIEGSYINIPLINGKNIIYGLCTKLFNKRVQHAQILKSETEQRTNHMKRNSVHLLLN